MALKKGKHILEEIDGILCTIVETGVSAERMDFLKKILSHNKFDVVTKLEAKKEESSPQTYTIGVTSLIFNPMTAIYFKQLRTPEGRLVTPAYWNQWTDKPTNQPYWLLSRNRVDLVEFYGTF